MAGQTIIEKILSARAGKKVSANDMCLIELDVRSARDFGGANVVKNFKKEYPGAKIADPKKTFFTFDCVVPANTIPYANNQQIARVFGSEQGARVFDVDAGIGSHVLIEQGLAVPGATIVGTDSHLNIMGAVGAFGQGMGDMDITFSFKTGKTWFEVPETIKLTILGEMRYPVTPRDLTEAVVGHFGANGALPYCVEIYGGMIDSLDLPGRVTLASMATETGAISFLIPPSEAVVNFCSNKAGRAISPVYADKDARYAKEITLDFTGKNGLQPLISLPGQPENVKKVREVAGTKVDSVFIGSCTNGRFEDFRLVAEFMGQRKVANHVMAKMVPATKEVFGRLLESGLMQRFHTAGWIVSNQGCGGCASGQVGMTGKGEVQISTSNRNFKGKQGDGDTYLASPLVAAASAIAGKITDPRDLME